MKRLAITVGFVLCFIAWWFLSTGKSEYPPASVNSTGSVRIEKSRLVKPVATNTYGAAYESAESSVTHQKNLSRLSEDVLPLLNRISPQGRILHDRLTSERRDQVWATNAEMAIRSAYTNLEAVGAAGKDLDIECGTTVCQVSGTLQDLPIDKASEMMHAVQSIDLMEGLNSQGYKLKDTSFGKGGKGKEIFVAYFNKIK